MKRAKKTKSELAEAGISVEDLLRGPKNKKRKKSAHSKVLHSIETMHDPAKDIMLSPLDDPPPSLWPSLEKEDTSDLKEVRRSLGVVVKGALCPRPLGVKAWTDDRLPLSHIWRRACTSFSEATPVQRQAWPAALAGLDLTAIAPVGSGKTLAYLLPTAARIIHHTAQKEQAIILSPTRELAHQIGRVATALLKSEKEFQVIVIAGGTGAEGKPEQRRACTVASLIVATPGRLAELAPPTMFKVRVFILDEADKMLKLGFEPQLDSIAKRLGPRSTRQHLLFTATFPQQLRQAVTDRFSTIDRLVTIRVNCASVSTSSPSFSLEENEEQTELPRHVEQRVHVCAPHKRTRLLVRFLEKLKKSDRIHSRRQASKLLILANKATTVDALAKELQSHQKVAVLHGKKPQDARNAALNDFRAGKAAILIATDVAGRGLDLKGLRFLINWDFPPNLDIYTHRLGRLGRDLNSDARRRATEARLANKNDLQEHPDACVAVSFFTRSFAVLAKPLIDLLTSTNQRIDPELSALVEQQLQSKSSSNQAEQNEVHFATPEDGAEGDGAKRKKRRKKQQNEIPSPDLPTKKAEIAHEEVDARLMAALRSALS